MMKHLKRSAACILFLAAAFVPQFCFADVLPDDPAEKAGSFAVPVIIALVVAAAIAIVIIKRRKK